MRPVTGILDVQSTTILFREIIINHHFCLMILMSHCIWLNQIESPLFENTRITSIFAGHIPSLCGNTSPWMAKSWLKIHRARLCQKRCTIETHGQGLPLQTKYALDMWDKPGTTPQIDRTGRKVNCAWQTLRLKRVLWGLDQGIKAVAL